MVGDYIVQNQWMANNKTKRVGALLVHVACYTACFIPVAWLFAPSFLSGLAFLAMLASLHALTDCRRWASGEAWPPKPILVDQALHAVQLAVLGVIFLGGAR